MVSDRGESLGPVILALEARAETSDDASVRDGFLRLAAVLMRIETVSRYAPDSDVAELRSALSGVLTQFSKIAPERFDEVMSALEAAVRAEA